MKGRKLVTKCLIIFAFHNNHVTAIRKRIFFPKRKTAANANHLCNFIRDQRDSFKRLEN